MKALDIAETLKALYSSDSYTETLVDFERVLDAVHLYGYKNWKEGELVLGPVTERHLVSCSFMWPEKQMPDPDGARRLLDYGAKVTYRKDTYESPIDIKVTDKNKPDYEQYQEGGKYPKIMTEKVWVVNITMPKHLMKEIYRGSVEIEGDSFDLQDMTSSVEQAGTPETGVADGS